MFEMERLEGEVEELSRPLEALLDGEEPGGPDSASSSCSDLSNTKPVVQPGPNNNSKSFPGLRLFGRRKAIAKAGVQDNAAQSGTITPAKSEPNKKICNTVDWTENAQLGQHVWFETSPAGDFCYVGESNCIAKSQQKSLPRHKCAACKISVHTECMNQLDKINFRCKPTFKDPGTKNVRETPNMNHHWVHRRRQDGKCRQCGKGFQQKFSFHSKDIVAISCSWCKQAYHNKVNCFMMQRIDEPCSLGAHAAVIIPPTWIIRMRRQQASLKSSKRRKRTSLKAKPSKKLEDGKWRNFVVRAIPSQHMKPLLVFVNPKSGGNQGTKIIRTFMWYLNPRQVFDLTQGGPREGNVQQSAQPAHPCLWWRWNGWLDSVSAG